MTDRTEADIRHDIRELKRAMKSEGVAIRSCFNGGHTSESLRYNQRLFALKAELERALT